VGAVTLRPGLMSYGEKRLLDLKRRQDARQFPALRGSDKAHRGEGNEQENSHRRAYLVGGRRSLSGLNKFDLQTVRSHTDTVNRDSARNPSRNLHAPGPPTTMMASMRLGGAIREAGGRNRPCAPAARL